nr:putative reverse transcriptase domain-containing protein [Tanacetum cinerariifolium]
MIDQGVTTVLAARDALRSTNGDDSHNYGTGVRRIERATHECTYIDFLKCQPLPFKGTKGVASLSQWFERMESVFHISNCAVENQVKFATCTLHFVALTWWNTHVKTVGHEAAYGMPWKTLMKMMTEKYCQKPICYECGVQGHFKRECPKLKNNNNHGNQGGRNNASARVYVVGRAGTDPDVNVMTVIACAEKIVRIPWENKTLIIHGDDRNQGYATRLSIISCTKTEKYVMKGFLVFLAHITTKEVEDKSEKKRLEDMPIVRNFLEVFPEDLPGLPPTRPVEFQIDLVPGAAPVARAPYQLAPSEMKEMDRFGWA